MKKYFFTAFIPVFLFFVGIGLILADVYKNEGNFFSIQAAINNNQLHYPGSILIKGQKLSGSFIAQYDNLGTISVRFATHLRINEDSLLFRIREQGNPNWNYEAKYKTDQFQPNQLFPFGFPTIRNSKNKKYEFEIISVDGTNGNAVSIKNQFPVSVASYTLDKQYYLSVLGEKDKKHFRVDTNVLKNVIWFLTIKTFTIMILGQYADSFLLYLSPIPIYFFWYWLIINSSPKIVQCITSHSVVSVALFVLVFARILVFRSNSSFYSFFIFVAWVAGILLYRFDQENQAKNFISKKRWAVIIIPILMILKALFVTKSQDNMTMTIVLLWFAASVIYKYHNRVNFYLSLLFLGLTIAIYYTKYSYLAEQTAAWVVVFLGFLVFNELFKLIALRVSPHAK